MSSSEVDLSWTEPPLQPTSPPTSPTSPPTSPTSPPTSPTSPPTSPQPVGAPAVVHSGVLLAGKYVRGAPAGGYKYNVYTGTSATDVSKRVNTEGPVTGNTFQVTGLQAGTTYYFAVTTVTFGDPDGGHSESGLSKEAHATTLPSGGGSAAPTGLTAAAVSSSEVDLSWTVPGSGAPAGGYDVYDGTSPGGESGPVNHGLITGTSFPVAGLHAGTTYYFKVTAVDAGKESGFSNEAQATTPTLVPAPGPPWGVLGGLAVIVAAIVGVFVWRRLHPHWPPDPVIKAVPHAGPPLAKSIHATGRGPTHTVRIESHPGKSITTMEEVGPR